MAGVLYLDVEGGRGGSSRSLGLLITHLDRFRFRPIVALRETGASHELYASLDVPHRHVAGMPAFRPGTRKNTIAFGLFVAGWARSGAIRRELLSIMREHGVDLVHVNHEGLAVLGRALARAAGVPWICHLRNTYPDTAWARRLYRLIATADGHIYISENERRHLVELAGLRREPENGIVVYNSAPGFDRSAPPDERFCAPPGALRVLSLANLDMERGTDLIVDVAGELKRRGKTDFRFFICGKDSRNGLSLRGDFAGMLRSRIVAEGLEEMVNLVGHVTNPEAALVSADILFRPRRQNNPWGRDVIEGMAAGLPIIAMGTFQGFVENGLGGFIDPEFSKQRIADHLVLLQSDPGLRERMGEFNRAKAARMFDGKRNAAMVEALYDKVLALRGGAMPRMPKAKLDAC